MSTFGHVLPNVTVRDRDTVLLPIGSWLRLDDAALGSVSREDEGVGPERTVLVQTGVLEQSPQGP